MKKHALIMAVLMAVLAAIMLCGAAENKEPETEQEVQVGCAMENQAEPKHDYTNLRGTRYKNLYATKYPNLAETLVKQQIAEEEAALGNAGSGNAGNGGGNAGNGGGNNWQQSVGTAENPGYSGSSGSGSYSMSDKTVAAHLSVQGTDVQNRAIWQAKGNTNYYTNGSVTWAAGSANLRSGELSQNTVIYGHNWGNCFVPFKKTGPEFESLMAYSYEDFVKDNQYIYLTTNSGTHTFQVFAVCFTTDLSFYINCNNIDVSDVADRAKGMSLFDFGVSVGDTDKIITLSTCTRYYKGLGANQRFIIMGKLV